MHGGSCRGMPGPPTSQSYNGGTAVEDLSSRFNKWFSTWLSENAVVACATVDGVKTFQLQFKDDLRCPEHQRHVPGRTSFDHREGTTGSLSSDSLPTGPHSTKDPKARVVMPGQDSQSFQTDNDVGTLVSTNEEGTYEVAEILGSRKRGKGRQVHVKWVGYDHPTWEPLGNLLGAEALETYEAKYGKIAP